MSTASTASDDAGTYQRLALTAIVASKTNPRTHFDDAYLAELATSIRDKGLLNPILVRPLDTLRAVMTHPDAAARNGAKFEIVAGECRFRASTLADLKTVPAIVREMTDDQVLEAQLEENIHRKDLTPLEEAAGYRRLIASNPTKHSAESIATRIGMSVGYVWDRLKLNDLIPEARAILEQGLITVGHGILLSRLKPADQTRAIAVDRERGHYDPRAALWRADHGFHFDSADPANKDRKRGKYDGVKPCSVREFEAWIRDHVRFDVAHAAQAQPFTFEQTAVQVEAAAAQPGRGKKVIPITHEYRVADDARDESERTYGRHAWHRADGQAKSKTCDHAVLGVVVAGEGYGDTLRVCVAREKCEVHFGAVIRQKERNAKLRDAGHGKQAARNESKQRETEEARWKRQREERDRKEKAWNAVRETALERLAASLKKEGPTQRVVDALMHIDGYMHQSDKKIFARLMGKVTAKNVAVALLFARILDDDSRDFDEFQKIAKVYGADLTDLAADYAKRAAPPAAAAPKPAKKTR